MSCAAASKALSWALIRSAERAGISLQIHRAEQKRWSSATFEGARHLVMLGSSSSHALQRWLEGLAEADLPIGGHLVAELKVDAVSTHAGRTDAMLQVLTVEDR